MIIFSQAVTIIVVPFIAVAFLVVANDETIMGDLKNTWFKNVIGILGLIVLVILAINNVINKSNAELSEIITLTSSSTDLIRDLHKKRVYLDSCVGVKMGLSMAKLAKRAIEKAGLQKRVFGVSRFSSGNLREALEVSGVDTIACDLLNDAERQGLSDTENCDAVYGEFVLVEQVEHFRTRSSERSLVMKPQVTQ